MNTTHLQLSRLAVGYKGKALISGIEIGVQRGEIVTLAGPNGSGKSTILKTITRQLTPVCGEVLLAESMKEMSVRAPKPDRYTAELKKLEQYAPVDLAKQMAVMLTGRLQTELMTCRDVTAMGRYPYTGRLGILSEADERKVDEALAMVHAQELADRPFDAVSDGERQRILLSRAICQEPEIIILDEPTSYLDIRHKLELLDILHKMSREQGITVVMSLHEIDLAMKVSDRIICVKGEEIFACGKPAEVLGDETVQQLYDLDPALGRFDARTGSLELNFKKSGDGPEEEEDCAYSECGTSSEEYTASQQFLSLPRFMIAAPGSGSGKTLITCGLLRLLKRQNFRPAAFKCGPDYIDPMFHRQVLGIPSRNLDTFFSPADSTVSGNSVHEIMARTVLGSKADISVIEGVMGYFDGTGASGTEASSFDLAQQTDTPVILAVSAKGMGRSIVPLLKGFAEYERGNGRICGVILNRVTSGSYEAMKKWIEEDTSLKVVGYVPQDDRFRWGSRYLGLMQPSEMADLQGQIDHLADVLSETIDQEALLEIARSAPSLHCNADIKRHASDPSSPRIAVARDEAFNFYYDDNLELLQECGAQLVFFSPLHDRELPGADGLLIGGGYPELYAKELSENEPMRAGICARAAEGMPILAECGGFMYLQQAMELPGKDGASKEEFPVKKIFPMCGVLPGTSRMTDKLVRFGYIELEKKGTEAGTAGYLQSGHHIRGHEFHYFDSTDNGEACTARKPGRERSWDCMAARENIMAGFPHLYYRSDPAFAEAFVERCRRFAAGRDRAARGEKKLR